MTTEFNEERIDTIGPNGNDGLHYEKDEFIIEFEDIKTVDQLKEVSKMLLTIVSGNRETVTSITLSRGSLESYPNLKDIAKVFHGEDTTA